MGMLEQIHGKYVRSYNVFDPDSKPYARFCYVGGEDLVELRINMA
jgi:hypothetical protein